MRVTSARSRMLRVGCVVSLAGLTACSDRFPTAPKVRADEVRAAVTAYVAALLDENGQFILPPPPPTAGPQLTVAQARALARAYWRSYASTLRVSLGEDRGAPIAQALAVCPRAYFVKGAYQDMPVDFPQTYQRAYGDQWLVGLCNGDEQQVAITIAAAATDVQILPDGRLYGNEVGNFYSVGVAPGANLPATPELAVVQSAREFQTRTAALPELRRPGRGFSALDSKWVLATERRTVVVGRESRVAQSVDTLVFGPFKGMLNLRVMVENPDSAATTPNESFLVAISATESRTFTLRRRAGAPYRLEPVDPGGE